MTCWYVKNLGDAMLADHALSELQSALDAYRSDPMNEPFDVFIRHESDGRLHCELMVYLPPQARAFAAYIGASTCIVPPGSRGLSTL